MKNIYARLKRMIACLGQGWRKEYDFPSVSKWLNNLTAKQIPFSLIFEHGQTWLMLNSGVWLKYLNLHNSVTSILISNGSYEDKELFLVCRNLSNGGVFFDIGANVGIFSLLVARAFDDIKIHAFEPIPEVAHEFSDNLLKNQIDANKVIINQVAVNNTEGWNFITLDYHASNFITQANSKYNKIKVPCITIDGYVKEKGIERLDLIKIDVEGKEFAVLQGAKETLGRFRPIVLAELIEDPSDYLDREIDDSREVVNFMLHLGYKYYVIDDKQNLISMSDLERGEFKRSYHNYLFYLDDVKI